jgi:hypothetical protein
MVDISLKRYSSVYYSFVINNKHRSYRRFRNVETY